MKKRLSPQNAVTTPISGTTRMINYEYAHSILEVEFIHGDVYHYLEVPAAVWNEYRAVVLAGESSGIFVNTKIKPYYLYIKII